MATVEQLTIKAISEYGSEDDFIRRLCGAGINTLADAVRRQAALTARVQKGGDLELAADYHNARLIATDGDTPGATAAAVAALSALVAQLHQLAWAMDQKSDPELGRIYPTLEPPMGAAE
jgi:hypothetical protein